MPSSAPARSAPNLATMVLLVALVVLTLNMFLPALPAMAEAFGVSEPRMGLAVSAYMVVAGALQLIIGPISDRIGRRPMLIAALAAYVIASAGAFLANSYTLFMVCRLAQALILAGSVVGLATLRDMYSTKEAAGKMGTIAAAMAIAPMIGPSVGGILETVLGWRAIFALYTGLGAAGLVLALIDWGETLTSARRSPREQAKAYLELVKTGLFWAYALCTMFSTGSFYVFLTGAPFVAGEVFGLSSALVGVGLGSITAGFFVGSTLTSRLAPKLGLAPLILTGRLIALAGLCAAAALFALGLSHPLFLFGGTIFVGLGNGLTIANTNAGMISVRPDLAGSAAGLSGALQLLGGAVMTWATLLWIEAAATPLRLLGVIILVSLGALIFGVLANRGAARMTSGRSPAA